MGLGEGRGIMDYPTHEDPLGLRADPLFHTNRMEEVARMIHLVDGMAKGKDVPVSFFNDPLFCRAVVHRLKEAEHWRRAAEKLATIKEVFGGNK